MPRFLDRRPSPPMVVAVLALFVALGGGAYAATALPKKSVGAKQIKKNAVTAAKIRKNAVNSSKVRDGSLLARDFGTGQLPTGPGGPQGQKGDTGATGAAGTARAFAHVTRGAAGAVVLDSSRSFGVSSAELPSTGNTDRPCVVLDDSIDATKEAAVVSVDSQNTPSFPTAVATVRVGGEGSQGCPANSIAIFVRRNNNTGGDDIAFNVIVP
jgi:hypothetical protein